MNALHLCNAWRMLFQPRQVLDFVGWAGICRVVGAPRVRLRAVRRRYDPDSRRGNGGGHFSFFECAMRSTVRDDQAWTL
jgi:hypothetical protein